MTPDAHPFLTVLQLFFVPNPKSRLSMMWDLFNSQLDCPEEANLLNIAVFLSNERLPENKYLLHKDNFLEASLKRNKGISPPGLAFLRLYNQTSHQIFSREGAELILHYYNKEFSFWNLNALLSMFTKDPEFFSVSKMLSVPENDLRLVSFLCLLRYEPDSTL